MLEDTDSMKANPGLHSAYNDSAAKGRPLLPAAVQAEKLVMQLIGWAAQMPLFATLITGQCATPLRHRMHMAPCTTCAFVELGIHEMTQHRKMQLLSCQCQ